MKLLLLIAACIAASQAADPSPLFNDRLDEVIRDTIEKHKDEISPYRVADQKVGFSQKIGPISVTGEAGFTNNSVQGLTNIRRVHDAYLETLPSKDVKLTLNLAIGPVELLTDGHVKFMGIGPRISYKVDLAHANGKAVLLYNHKVEEVTVESFEVNDLIGLNFRILKSPGFVTPFITSQIVNGAMAVFNPVIKAGVTRAGSTILDYMVRDSELVKDLMTEAYNP